MFKKSYADVVASFYPLILIMISKNDFFNYNKTPFPIFIPNRSHFNWGKQRSHKTCSDAFEWWTINWSLSSWEIAMRHYVIKVPFLTWKQPGIDAIITMFFLLYFCPPLNWLMVNRISTFCNQILSILHKLYTWTTGLCYQLAIVITFMLARCDTIKQ